MRQIDGVANAAANACRYQPCLWMVWADFGKASQLFGAEIYAGLHIQPDANRE